MAAVITGITPSKGSPFGGQVITITGTGFGTSGSVKVDGITATPGTWSATSVTVTTPARNTGSGVSFAGGTVVVLLTAQDLTTATTSYEYQKTRVEMAVDSMAARFAACSVQSGYNFDIGASQVRAMKEDASVSSGVPWPQVIAYVEDGTTLTDEPYDFSKDTTSVIVQAVMPCDNPQTWRNQAMAMISDLRRAGMRDRSNSGTCNTTTVLGWEIGMIVDNAAGALAGASVTFQIEVPSANNDMTTATTYNANLS